ncbi:protein phosphatase CheZ [Ramlibacter alkalitolerans]|uniref:Protein phosphatase CheZ n=1 Tax=Ramlibacter alkalitolerans TaxID=2039631 RepID=A0ABS1JL17_9BURK|nr:protein phosphatase CheZ [Ramlibacter alkalitolerans]MBL0424871.1 protein phosphatase CheZ [Ramlibacter alkalitolerans]
MTDFQESMDPATQRLYQRVGELTRRLHEALRELGYDKRIEASLGAVPDAKQRLSFIARLTGEAAEKVLNNVDAAQAQQQALAERADAIAALAESGAAGAAGAEVARFADEVRAGARATHAQLTDIMLAQDFHDLTGQTVRKVVEVATTMEEALLQLLLDSTPAAPARGALDGPVADDSRADVVANQAQVDDLLESLGF